MNSPVGISTGSNVAAFFTTGQQSRTLEKLDSFASLQAGWHYGRGKTFTARVLFIVSLLERQAGHLGVDQTDVFPGQDGDITLALYRGEDEFFFRVQESGEIAFDSEWQPLEEPVPMSFTDALDCLEQLAARNSWKSFSFFTSGTMTPERDASEVRLAKTQATAAEYQFSVGTARWASQGVFALTLVITTLPSPQSLPSFGASTQPVSQLVTS